MIVVSLVSLVHPFGELGRSGIPVRDLVLSFSTLMPLPVSRGSGKERERKRKRKRKGKGKEKEKQKEKEKNRIHHRMVRETDEQCHYRSCLTENALLRMLNKEPLRIPRRSSLRFLSYHVLLFP